MATNSRSYTSGTGIMLQSHCNTLEKLAVECLNAVGALGRCKKMMGGRRDEAETGEQRRVGLSGI